MNLTKNDIEELFVFIMKVKWIPIEDWKLEDSICKWWISIKCKQTLWK
jgi:hypothetical protein